MSLYGKFYFESISDVCVFGKGEILDEIQDGCQNIVLWNILQYYSYWYIHTKVEVSKNILALL